MDAYNFKEKLMTKLEPITLTPVGIVRSAVTAPADDIWGGLVSRIELQAARFSAQSLVGLEEFSHVQILFYLHLVADETLVTGSRHPRGRTDWPEVGIFAQRGKNRPNKIGLSTCRLLGVEGTSLTVANLDAIDGTPVLDIKPYVAEFGPVGEVKQPAWATELMARYFGPRQHQP
jgi:tRNA-Thr(GGU) m(6)t(6)A37 methyltransferase TsaA